MNFYILRCHYLLVFIQSILTDFDLNTQSSIPKHVHTSRLYFDLVSSHLISSQPLLIRTAPWENMFI